ncbi:Cytosolic Fe-S cluster assembly factor nar1 [Maublancomyces gigas]|uniref:Nuclear architecture-related protein 1 n=1 Tax=Discina gigas TaxID=1032678 RepID=A0ABR3G6B4_9PEZI
MSAILSADGLNDFISPGVACIKPVEILPAAPPRDESNPYQVLREDKAPPADLGPAQISLTDCLACSGCVTSAEAVLVSLQSHNEVLSHLSSAPPDTLFVALVSPQTRASLAATYGVSSAEAGFLVEQLLCGDEGLGQDQHHRRFDLVLDTSGAEQLALHYAAEELLSAPVAQRPILASACPGFVCYLESTQPALIPHLSALKSPQAILATAVKALLRKSGRPVYITAIMPCFDKKLEGSRRELTSAAWDTTATAESTPTRDVDCVITTRELISLGSALNITLSSLPRRPVVAASLGVPALLRPLALHTALVGSSGGYIEYIAGRILAANPGTVLAVETGRNSDAVEYVVSRPGEPPVARLARCYGFRNIQNLVRRLKPAKARALPRARARVVGRPKGAETVRYDYVEVMACPGGCTNGGGQVRFGDEVVEVAVEGGQKEWLRQVEERYYESGEEKGEFGGDLVERLVDAWERETGVERAKLLYTSYRKVENDLGRRMEEVSAAELAGKAGGGW